MKVRADQLLVTKGLVPSRSKAQALILAGQVYSTQKRIDKAGELVDAEETLELRGDLPYVSRGGIKLAHALDCFTLPVEDRVALDIGASTGGFTDCLLQRGVRKVYALDVGYGQLDWSLRQDPRVVVIERTNVRNWRATEVQEPIDLIVIDVSFISLKKVLPQLEKNLEEHLGSEIFLITLIKPQFEAKRSEVASGGVVRDTIVQSRVVAEIQKFIGSRGWKVIGVTPAPIKGPKGNQEYLLAAEREGC